LRRLRLSLQERCAGSAMTNSWTWPVSVVQAGWPFGEWQSISQHPTRWMIGEYERLPGSHLRMNRRVSLLNRESADDSRFTSIFPILPRFGKPVTTGEPAFRRRFGMDSFSFMAQHPEEAANFDKAMADFTSQIANAVAASYDFSGFALAIDVGGGNGALLAGILQAYPNLRGLLFEQSHVAERAGQWIETAGIADRCEAVGGDFFAQVPGGADVYILKHVIHDWDDDRAVAILRNCRRAMRGRAKLLVIEGIYPSRIDQSDASRGAASNDVNMLVCTGGRQRSEEEFRSLYQAAGFRLTRIIPTPARVSLVEGACA